MPFKLCSPHGHGGYVTQEDEVRGAEMEVTRKLPPKRAAQTGADEDDIMLEGADDSQVKSSVVRH